VIAVDARFKEQDRMEKSAEVGIGLTMPKKAGPRTDIVDAPK
jgi:hypothetical protein